MYQNEWDAAVARATSLEAQLRQAQQAPVQDQMLIAQLTVQLQGARAELARLQGAMPQPMYGMGMGGYAQQYMYPDRSGTVLILGILSLVVCSIMGPIAWSMGNEELRRIDAGQTTPQNRGTASAGRICGMISSVLMIAGIVIFVIAMVFALSAGSQHSSSY